MRGLKSRSSISHTRWQIIKILVSVYSVYNILKVKKFMKLTFILSVEVSRLNLTFIDLKRT